jgi:hypothetical protein
VFGNRRLRRIFGSKGKQVVGDWRRLHNEELHNLFAAPYIIRVMKSRTVIWVCMGEMCTKFQLEDLKERDDSEDIGLDGRIILECILGKWGGKVWS